MTKNAKELPRAATLSIWMRRGKKSAGLNGRRRNVWPVRRARRCAGVCFPSFLVLVLVLGAVLVTVYWDDINFDALRRTISISVLRRTKAGEPIPFFYDRGSQRLAVLGNHLICATNKETTIYDFAGNELYQADVKLESPVLCVGGSLAAVYEVGGSHLTVFNEQGQKLNLILENGLGIYAASLNEADYLAVTSQKKSKRLRYRITPIWKKSFPLIPLPALWSMLM